MKTILCLFAIALSVAVYPVTLFINGELTYIFNHIEIDFFNWCRMILVSLSGISLLLSTIKKTERPVAIYLGLLLLSLLLSRFPETSLYGTPMHHEGFFAILGYFGIYQATKKCGFFKGLEVSLDVVVYIAAFFGVLQVVYGNFLNFPLFKAVIPKLLITAETWPIYGNMGGPNHLGLFCSLFLPYTILRKKYLQAVLLVLLLFGCQTRGAWLSCLVTTALISRRYLGYLVMALIVLSIPAHEAVRTRIKATLKDIHYPIRDSDFNGRAYMWKRGLPVLKDSIIVGKGPATYTHYIPQFTERGDQMGFHLLAIDRPHNIFINIWESTGLLSLIVLGLWLTKIDLQSSDASLKMGIVGFLIAGIFTDSVLSVTPYFFIFTGGLANEHNEKRRHDEGTARTKIRNRLASS